MQKNNGLDKNQLISFVIFSAILMAFMFYFQNKQSDEKQVADAKAKTEQKAASKTIANNINATVNAAAIKNVTVKNKRTNRPWVKPDWAYIEEGLPVPPARSPDRIEMGTLGEYALELGDGYMLHGTLYQRFLGLPVTHGCVRLGDDDLEVIYNTLSLGSKVYIY